MCVWKQEVDSVIVKPFFAILGTFIHIFSLCIVYIVVSQWNPSEQSSVSVQTCVIVHEQDHMKRLPAGDLRHAACDL